MSNNLIPNMSFNNGNQQRTRIKITELLITETGTYNPQYRRAYQSELDAGVLSVIEQNVARANDINPMLLSGLADQIIRPATEAGKVLTIPNGWEERRLRFRMAVETNYSTGGRIIEHIQGYTDVYGMGHSGALAPEMEFRINSILKVRETVVNTPMGPRQMFNVIENKHVLVNRDWNSIYDQGAEERMRPEDVYMSMSRGQYENMGTNYMDMRTTQNNQPVFSDRKHGIPTNFLAGIMDGYRQAVNSPVEGIPGNQAVMASAAGMVTEPSMAMDPFIKLISQIKGAALAESFTYRDLQLMDPDVVHVTQVVRAGNLEQLTADYHQAGQTSSWTGRDMETKAATMLCNAVPAIMMELGFTFMHFKSNNHTIGCKPHTEFINSESFSNVDMSAYLSVFKNRFEREVMSGITFNNEFSYMLEMKVDLMSETLIRVSINGDQFVDFAQPSFSDALMVPVLSPDKHAVSKFATDMENFLAATIASDNDLPGMGGIQQDEPRFII